MPLPSSSAPIEANELGKGDILDILNDDGPEKESLDLSEPEPAKQPDKEATEEAEPDEKKEEIKLADEEEKEDEEYHEDEDLDIITPARRKDILKKYPNLFKEFPHLEKAYYRDQQYNEMFSTPDEARELIQTANAFSQYANRVNQGSTEEVLRNVRDNNPEAFGKIVDNYLLTLRAVDDRAFYHVIGNTIKTTVASMVQEANRTQNDNLLQAARILHQYVTGTTEWREPTTYSKQRPQQEVEQQNQLTQERVQFFQERVESIQTDLQSRVDGVLKNTIDQNIDPKQSMTPYVRRVAVNEVMESVQNNIDRDPSFRKLLDRLWERAAEDRFSKTSIEKIRSAYLSKAKTLLPDAIKKSRNEALKGLGKRVREDNDENTRNTSNKRESASSPSTLRGSNAKDNPSKGKSTFAFLNED